MLGLNCHILYRKGRENLTTNALSRRDNFIEDKQNNEGKEIDGLVAITKVVSAWYEKIYDSYKTNAILQNVITGKLNYTNQYQNYTYKDVVMYIGRLVVGVT